MHSCSTKWRNNKEQQQKKHVYFLNLHLFLSLEKNKMVVYRMMTLSGRGISSGSKVLAVQEQEPKFMSSALT